MAMKKILLVLMIVLLFTITACSNSEEVTDTVAVPETEIIETEVTVVETTVATTEATQPLDTYYDRDETINLYLNRFNTVNPNQQIDSSLFEVYYHHGSEHDDQIIFNRNDFEVVITGNSWGSSIKLVIDGNREKTSDDYKLMFMQYARAYNCDLTDEKLDEYWQTVMDDLINSVEFDEFDCSLQIFNDEIEYMVIEGKIK